MNNYLITGYWGEPHVTSENDRGIHAASFGTGRFVLPVGEQFNAEYIGNNTIRMYDGKLMNNGAAAGIPAGEYVDFLIANTGQGMKRNDLIVFQYQRDASTLVERGTFIVIQGTETTGTPVDPELTQTDLLSNTATLDQMALWRVSVAGINISAPVKLFSTYENSVMHAAKTNNPHRVTAAQAGAIPSTQKGTANGVATLGSDGRVPSSQLPPLEYVPLIRKINGMDLSEDRVLTAADVGASNVAAGTYVGAGTDGTVVTPGFTPKFVMVTYDTTTAQGDIVIAAFSILGLGVTITLRKAGTTSDVGIVDNGFTFSDTGFHTGKLFTTSGSTYRYFAVG